MFFNSVQLVLFCFLLGIYLISFSISYSYSIDNDTLTNGNLNESIRIIDLQVNLSKLPDTSVFFNNNSLLELTQIDKEMKDENEVVNETSEKYYPRNISSTNLDYKSLKSPIVNKRWYGMDIYSAAEVGKTNQSLRPINPPDVSIAVGKDHVAQVVHSSIQIWDKNGLTLDRKLLHDFFDINKDHYITDPTILYDNSTGRWFATIVDGGREEMRNGSSYYTCLPFCKVIIAVSDNDNPTQNWSLFPINASKIENFPDYPKIAVSKFNLIMTTKEFQVQPSLDESKSIQRAYIINKNFINNTGSLDFSSYSLRDPAYPVLYIQPSNTSSTVTLYKKNNTDIYSPVSMVQITDYVASSFTHKVSISKKFVEIPTLFPSPKFKQPFIDVYKKEELAILSAIRNDTSLWIALHSECQPVSISNNSCVNILRFDKMIPNAEHSDYTYNIAENMQFHIANTDVYYPAIGISKDGKVFFISGFSNSTIFPSLRISHLIGENQTKDIILILGSAVNNSTSYGDYFGSAIDPINGTVWLSGQYVDQSIPIPSHFPLEMTDKLRDKTWATIIANVL
jgi:hypothetical protein